MLSRGPSVHWWHHGHGGLREDLSACKSPLGKRPWNASAGSLSSYLCFETANLGLTWARRLGVGSKPPLIRLRCLFCWMTQRGDNAGRTGRWLMIYTAHWTHGTKSICRKRRAAAVFWSGVTSSQQMIIIIIKLLIIETEQTKQKLRESELK